MKKGFLILAVMTLGFNNISNAQNHKMSLEDFVVLRDYYNTTNTSSFFDDAVVFFTQPGVKKITVKKYNAVVSFGDIVKKENTPTSVKTCQYDNQGRLIALDATGQHIRIKYENGKIESISHYHDNGELRAKNIFTYSNGIYVNGVHTYSYDAWYKRNKQVYSGGRNDRFGIINNEDLANDNPNKYVSLYVIDTSGLFVEASDNYSQNKRIANHYTRKISSNGSIITKVVEFYGEEKNEKPRAIFEYEYEY